MVDRARCSSCSAEILWVRMPKGALMPLDPAEHPSPAVKLVAVNPKTGHGITLDAGLLEICKAWMLAGVTVHTSHWATCPSAQAHRHESRPQAESLPGL